MLLLILLLASVVFIILSTTKFNLHPFLALILAAIGFGLFAKMPLTGIVESINVGFGDTIGKIGIVIIAGTIIGTFLERSGGAFAMAEKILKLTGEKHVPGAMAIIGYIVSIPVFADSGFVILAPLNKALSKKAKISLAGSAMALALGLSVTHNLVPPTPGPIAAAGILGADLGLVILLGLAVSLPVLVIAWLFATKIASRIYMDPDPDLSEAEVVEITRQAPSAAKSFAPILVPILLIITKSVSDAVTDPKVSSFGREFFGFIGNPVIALLIGVFLAVRLPRKFETAMLSGTGWVGQGLITAALIVMITGAGGAFGRVLRDSGIATVIGDSLSKANLGIWLPFVIAAAVKTAQGSSTVALVTTASIVAPLIASLGFDSGLGKAFLVLAIGAGSIVVSHANDSFFWVLTQMSNMDVKTGYKLQTAGTLVIGCSAGFILWVVSLIVF